MMYKKRLSLITVLITLGMGVIGSGSLPLQGADETALLQAFRQEKDTVKRRKIFRELTTGKNISRQALLLGIRDGDAALQRYSLCLLSQQDMKEALGTLHRLASTRDPVTLDLVYGCAVRISDLRQQMALLRKIAASPLRSRSVLLAKSRVSFEFFRENKRLKESGAYDHDIQVIRTMELPVKGWAFTPDREHDGHKRGYFYESILTDGWKSVALGAWNKQGFPSYRGVAWYKIRFPMIALLPHESVELFFREVRSSAWVWLNGKYIGQDFSGSGSGFYLDVTDAIKWGQENVLTVRVESNTPAGGILRPVRIQLLK